MRRLLDSRYISAIFCFLDSGREPRTEAITTYGYLTGSDWGHAHPLKNFNRNHRQDAFRTKCPSSGVFIKFFLMSISKSPADPILTIKRFIFLSNNQLVSPQSQTKYLGKFQTKFSRSLELKIYFQKFFWENWTLSISKII